MTKKSIKIVTWNVNSIGVRQYHLIELIKKHNPDVILLQELKCISEKFPYTEFEDLGYNIIVFGQKTYNGVAILSKSPIDDTLFGIPNYSETEDARYIQCFTMINGIGLNVASVYVPNGMDVLSEKFQYKLRFLDALDAHLKSQISSDTAFIIGGDFNVAPEDIDVYNPKALDGRICFNIEERQRMRKILNNGMTDAFRTFHPDQQSFSWWDYRSGGWEQNKGMRIDYILTSPKAADLISGAEIDSTFRSLEKPSDHAPIVLSLHNSLYTLKL